MNMITPTITAANLDRCLYCHRPILTAYVYLPAVRGTNLVVTAHARCAELASERVGRGVHDRTDDADMPADQLATAKAEHLAGLLALEALFLPAPATADTARVPA
jgi:hypothetical protein